jgi:ATP-binding cassette subfamily F protein 3
MASAPDHLLQVDHLTFGYGADILFSDVSFSLAAGDRLAIVAPNGAGKSTLLRLLVGELKADDGRVVAKKGTHVGYYRQSHELDARAGEITVRGAFVGAFERVLELRRQLEQARIEIADHPDSEQALARLGDLEETYHHAGGDDVERKVESLAATLGFSDMDRLVSSLSGGERGRLLLGTVLAGEPEILLLDEPTNHLDIETISWLERYLRELRSGVIIVSHDRRLLDSVTTQTLELGMRSYRHFLLPYSQYLSARADELERERELVLRQKAFVEKEEDYIRKHIAGQNTRQAQGRRKRLARLERLEGPEDIWADAEKLRVRFADVPRSGDIALEAKGLGAKRGDRQLFSGVDLLLRRSERLGIIGPNGIGKTTLMKILAQQGAPDDEGSVRFGSNISIGYFDQHLGELDPSKTPVEEIRAIKPEFTPDGARQYLARFRVTGDDALRVISGFSGGERSRLALAKLLLVPRNLLFLDEPTNHLDIPSCEILEEALAEGFDGTLVLVSHDREFLAAVTTRLLVFTGGEVKAFPGGYDDYIEGVQPAASPSQAPSPAKKVDDVAAKKAQHEERRLAAREMERKKKKVVELETAIANEEAALAAFRKELADAAGGDWESLAKRANEERRRSQALDKMIEEWTRLSLELE